MPHELQRYWNRAIIGSSAFLILTIVLACAMPVRISYDTDPHGRLIPVAVAQTAPEPDRLLPGFAPATAAVAKANAPDGGGWGGIIDTALMALGVACPAAGAIALRLWQNYNRMKAYAQSAAELADAHEQAAIEAIPPTKDRDARAEALKQRLSFNKGAARLKQAKGRAEHLDEVVRPKGRRQ